jgi:hypothetical protein
VLTPQSTNNSIRTKSKRLGKLIGTIFLQFELAGYESNQFRAAMAFAQEVRCHVNAGPDQFEKWNQ